MNVVRDPDVRTIGPDWRTVGIFFAASPVLRVGELLRHTLRAIADNNHVSSHVRDLLFELEAGEHIERALEFGEGAVGLELVELNAHDGAAAGLASRTHNKVDVGILTLQHGILALEAALHFLDRRPA